MRLQGQSDEHRSIGSAFDGEAARIPVQVAQGVAGLVKRGVDDDAVGA